MKQLTLKHYSDVSRVNCMPENLETKENHALLFADCVFSFIKFYYFSNDINKVYLRVSIDFMEVELN